MDPHSLYELCIKRNYELEWAYEHGLISSFTRDLLWKDCRNYRYNLHGYPLHDKK